MFTPDKWSGRIWGRQEREVVHKQVTKTKQRNKQISSYLMFLRKYKWRAANWISEQYSNEVTHWDKCWLGWRQDYQKKRRRELYTRIPCRDCEASYIGEAGRTSQKRITEHKYAVKNNDRKNGIATHAWDHDHKPNWPWEEAEICWMWTELLERWVLEAIWMRRTQNTNNFYCGMTINETWATPI